MAKQAKQKEISTASFSALLKEHGLENVDFDEVHFVKNDLSSSKKKIRSIICKIWPDTQKFECK